MKEHTIKIWRKRGCIDKYINLCVTHRNIDDKKYDLTTTQQQILDLISADSTITIAELANQLQISTTAVSNAIKILKKKQRIDRKGSKKGGHWLILE